MASNGDLVTGFVRGRQNLDPQTCRHVILYLFFFIFKVNNSRDRRFKIMTQRKPNNNYYMGFS